VIVPADARVLLGTRGLRAFADGLVSVVLPTLLIALGLSGLQTGAIVTSTLLGSAAVTLAVGLRGSGIRRDHLLAAISVLMVATGVGFGLLSSFWMLLIVAAVGTINPSAGDVSAFLPTEQALLTAAVPDAQRTTAFAQFSLVASVMAALGSLAALLPSWLERTRNVGKLSSLRLVFFLYAGIGAAVLLLYRQLSSERTGPASRSPSALGPSRSTVLRLAAVFSIDSFGGGFVVQSIVALWLSRRFNFDLGTLGRVFFITGLCSAASALLAPRIARRVGLIKTMSYTHLPANVLLFTAPFMPNASLAVACLIARSLLSQMDVPARQSYVMSVVTPAERPAAASVTNVPRSLASAIPPVAAGWMLDHSTFGWPLVFGGVIKAIYDFVLLAAFRDPV
jgi:predicted MFS family arabinose efflux permease